jgi:secreted protein with Ig-like and vWFA domain
MGLFLSFPSPAYWFEFKKFIIQESQLEDYDPSLAVIADYSTIVIQYGFVTLFVAACPLVRIELKTLSCIFCVQLFALCNNLFN